MAGRAQHPFADRADQAGLLGDRDELGRRDQAELGMVPAQQGLEAGDLAGFAGDQRLVVELELARVERLAQVELDLRGAPAARRPCAGSKKR